MTKQYGILAYPAKHSLSGVMQNAAFKAMGMDAQYGLFNIPENQIPEFMEQVKHDPLSGLSVSLPYKQLVMNYMNKVDEDAEKIGAVNTVVNKGGFLYGYNADYLGSNQALTEAAGSLRDKKVVILGAGGAARAVVYGLLKEGADVTICNRTESTARELADYFGGIFGVNVDSGGIGMIAEIDKADILINTTSLWMVKEGAVVEDLIPVEYLEKFDLVEDIVYVPLKTPLIKAAESLGKKILTGEKMLLYQGAVQFKLWTGKEAPVEVMRKALSQALI